MFETYETLQTYACNMRFQCNIYLLLGRMEAHRRGGRLAELIGDTDLVVAELAGKTELGGGGTCGPQRRRVEVTGVELVGNAELGSDA